MRGHCVPEQTGPTCKVTHGCVARASAAVIGMSYHRRWPLSFRRSCRRPMVTYHRLKKVGWERGGGGGGDRGTRRSSNISACNRVG